MYLDNLIFYNESAVINIVKTFYSDSFSCDVISNELINPVHGPQLMDALFFLLMHPELYLIKEISTDPDLQFFHDLGNN